METTKYRIKNYKNKNHEHLPGIFWEKNKEKIKSTSTVLASY